MHLLTYPRWIALTLWKLPRPPVHVEAERDIGFKRYSDGCAHSPSGD